MPYKDKIKEKSYQKQYQFTHKTEWKNYHKNYSKQWYIDNKIIVSNKHKQYRDTHKIESKLNRDSIRLKVLNHYSNHNLKCKNCNEIHIEFLEIDHINGGGKKHKKSLHLYGNALYRWLVKNNYPDGYQVLCSNCNWKKRKSSMVGITGSDHQKSRYKRSLKLRNEIFSHYTTNDIIKCSCNDCNVTDLNVLTIDHKNGNGSDHRKRVGYGDQVYKDIKMNNYPAEYRILCRNCNQSLGNYGYCPHDL